MYQKTSSFIHILCKCPVHILPSLFVFNDWEIPHGIVVKALLLKTEGSHHFEYMFSILRILDVRSAQVYMCFPFASIAFSCLLSCLHCPIKLKYKVSRISFLWYVQLTKELTSGKRIFVCSCLTSVVLFSFPFRSAVHILIVKQNYT